MEAIELLIPRIKVIGPYPNSIYEIGEVLRFSADQVNAIKIWQDNCVKYPHIFKELAWYEDRDESIIRGIKYMKPPASADSDVVYKVLYIDPQELEISMWCIYFADAETDVIPYNISYWLPATELEYTQYITSQSKK